METAETVCMACLPPEEDISWKKYLGNRPLKITFYRGLTNDQICIFTDPGDSRSWESPEKADNVWLLFIQILLR